MAEGTPEKVAAKAGSYTGQFLQDVLPAPKAKRSKKRVPALRN